jgi:alpha-beta hydrolase superfamily lysophospholipase
MAEGASRVGPRASAEKDVSERIVFAETPDNLELRGVLIRGTAGGARNRALCLWVHTRQQNFAEREYVEIGRLVADAGHDFLSVDTRGHDFGCWFRTADGPVLHGSAWERFSDCVMDLDAWVDFALAEGYAQVVIVGHGFGGAKAVHFQAQRHRPEIAAVVLASSGATVRDKFTNEDLALAREMAASGRGRDLMPWGAGGHANAMTVSADWYLARAWMSAELYGTDSLPPAVARVKVPILAWYGAEENRPARNVEHMLRWIETNAVQAPVFHGRIVDNLGFYYRGREPLVANLLLHGLQRIGLSPAASAI